MGQVINGGFFVCAASRDFVREKVSSLFRDTTRDISIGNSTNVGREPVVHVCYSLIRLLILAFRHLVNFFTDRATPCKTKRVLTAAEKVCYFLFLFIGILFIFAR